MTRKGRCHICGEEADLTYEHIPPRKAFNDTGVLITEIDKLDSFPASWELSKGKTKQNGVGDYTLCGYCNNITGKWYGAHFVEYCKKGMSILKASKGNPKLFVLAEIYPLSIIKQIISFFLSINDLSFRDSNEELSRFVLNKSKLYLNPKYTVYTYFNIEGLIRRTPFTVKGSTSGKKPIVMTEFSFPPFGYLLCIDSIPDDSRLIEITHFSGYIYGSKLTASMDYHVLPTHLFFPGDYRTRIEIENAIKESKKYEDA